MKALIVPTLGESITEAVIGKWLVAVGEYVQEGEPVVDLETDKITIQLPAPVGGALSAQKYQVGDTVRVGDEVGSLDEAAAKPEKAAVAKPATPEEARPSAVPQPPAEVPERDSSGKPLSPSASTHPGRQTQATDATGSAQARCAQGGRRRCNTHVTA